ncbi:hypothetical protein Pcinc_020054 [Petrolisthes cinctipes]|uniref:Uncharacterized protein n=1 Tax=Petrolisthes cinctipes TaxID=88211 RepID=A0AAE1FIY8_PETCI|nr:hypothetical protein Pcinc_020054 [Petrolisthes cinctipes]
MDVPQNQVFMTFYPWEPDHEKACALLFKSLVLRWPFDNNCMPFGNNMQMKDMVGMSGGGGDGGNNNNMALEMELLKRQLNMVHHKYENERMQREMLEQERNVAMNPSMSRNNFNGGGGNSGGGEMGMQGGGNQMPRRYNSMSSSRNLFSLLDDNFSRLQSDRYRLPPQPPLTLNSFSSFGNGMQYQQGMKREAGPGIGNWDMKRQRY